VGYEDIDLQAAHGQSSAGSTQLLPAPHSAGQTAEGLRRMGGITAQNTLCVLRGEHPLFQVI
jgi:hypothetical protein